MRIKHILAVWLVVVVVTSLLLAPTPTRARQSFNSTSPDSGPPGTIVYVECSGSAYFRYDSINYDSTGETFDIAMSRQGYGTFEVPADARPNSELDVYCGADVEFPDFVGAFFVTDCSLGNINYFTTINTTRLIRMLNGGQLYTGADLGVDANGLFARTIDFSNQFGENLRLIVRSPDALQLLDYLNNIALDFKVDLVAPSQLDPDGCGNYLGNLSDPQPDGSVFRGDVDVELVLLTSSFVTAGSSYMVSYEIDPDLANDRVHTYRPRRSSAASAQVTADTGRVKLTMWNDANYINAIVLGATLPKLPALMNSVAPNQATYYSVVRGMDSGNRYTMKGSFGTQPCNPDREDCGEVILPQLRLAQGGIGMTNQARMNDGNFQVEGYCNGGYVQGYSGVARNDYDWYCTQGDRQYRLTQNDFNRMCQITYNNPNAVAISDKGESVPALNWRCYIRQ